MFFVISCSEIALKGNHLTATFTVAIKQIRVREGNENLIFCQIEVLTLQNKLDHSRSDNYNLLGEIMIFCSLYTK